jgi:hypothetical protein
VIRQPDVAAQLYLLYWYKSTNADAAFFWGEQPRYYSHLIRQPDVVALLALLVQKYKY